MSTSTLPGVTGSFPQGRSILYYDKKLYIGTHRTAGHEFHVYDASNPEQIRWLGSLELNHNINDIAIYGKYAFLATSGNIHDVIILDISKSIPVRLSNIDIAGNEDALTLSVLGKFLFIGKAKARDSNHPEFTIFDISDPYTPQLAGGFSLNETILSLTATGQTAYISTNASKLYVLDLKDLSQPKILQSFMLTNPISWLDYENQHIVGLTQSGNLINLH